MLSFETNSEVPNNSRRSIQYPFLESYNKQQPRPSIISHLIFPYTANLLQASALNNRLDRSSRCPVAFDRVTLGSISNEPYRPQIPVDPPGALRSFRRWIGTGSVGRTCRPPCPASGCHAWHPALFLDVRCRDSTRYRGGDISGRAQSDCAHRPSPFCTAFDRDLSDLPQPRPSVFLSIVSVAHRLAAGPSSISPAIH